MKDVILVIEDSDELRENTCELLELAGYDIVQAANGKEGLEQARKTSPDLILCDIMMPGLDGYGVLRAIENIPELNGTPFVFFTAKTTQSDFRTAMDLGADDYLPKPFTGDDLLRVVGARLKKNRLVKAKQAAKREDEPGTQARSLEEIVALSQHRTVKKLRNKDMIYMEGDTATHLCYVVSGKVKVYKTNEWGKEYITEIVCAGEFFGHLALFAGREHRHSAMAIENAEIVQIPRQEFLDQLDCGKEIVLKLIRLLAENLEESEDKLLHLAYDSARKRVAEALLFIYRHYKKEEEPGFAFPVNRENLSAIAGISPESVSRNLTDFKEEHLIATDSSNIRIVDFRKLAGLRG